MLIIIAASPDKVDYFDKENTNCVVVITINHDPTDDFSKTDQQLTPSVPK